MYYTSSNFASIFIWPICFPTNIISRTPNVLHLTLDALTHIVKHSKCFFWLWKCLVLRDDTNFGLWNLHVPIKVSMCVNLCYMSLVP